MSKVSEEIQKKVVSHKKSTFIRTKMVYVLFLSLMIIIIMVGGIFSYFTKKSLIDTIAKDGFYTAERFVERLEDNAEASKIVNIMFESRIRTACNTILQEQQHLSNEYLKIMANKLQVDEINWYDSQGEIIYSSLLGSQGYTIPNNHPLRVIMQGKQELMEDIRKDTQSDQYLKYGAVRNYDGSFVQVGVLANKVHEIADRFNYQTLMNSLAESDQVIYATVLDNNAVIIASNDIEDLGYQEVDLGSITGAIYGKPYASEYYADWIDETVYDVVYPIALDGRHIGAINIGYSMQNIRQTIRKNITVIFIAGCILFVFLFIVLNKIFNKGMRVIDCLKDSLEIMATGDFTQEIPNELLLRTDEFGQIASSLAYMQKSVKKIMDKKAKVEQELSKSEKRYRSIAEVSDIGTWEYDVERDYIWYSTGYFTMLGYSPDEIKENEGDFDTICFRYLHHEDKVKALNIYKKCIQENNNKMYENLFRMKRKDGSWAWILSRGKKVILENNQQRVIGCHIDITGNKILEEKAKESELRFRLLVDKMQFGLALHEIILDEEGKPYDYRFLSVNEKFEELTGMKAKDIIGKRVREVMPKTQQYWVDIYGKVALTGKSREYENYSEELGKWYRAVAYSPKHMQFAVIIDDISERKKMEELLYLQKEQFKTTLMSIGDGVISTDEKCGIVLMNKVAERLICVEKKQAYSKNVKDIFKIINENTQEPYVNSVKNVLETGRTIDFSNHAILINQNGRKIPIEYSVSPIKSSNQKVTGAVIVFKDVTEQREKQKQIEYLSLHDYFTDLYNRRYMEEAIKQMDIKDNLPLTMMVLDVNGLKLTNDVFGHEMGDKLLKKVVGVIKKVCHSDNIVARMGGDEFWILFPNTNKDKASKIKNEIMEEAAKTKIGSVIVSIAVGYDVKTKEEESINLIIRNAENFMYEGKIKHGRVMRSQTIENVLRSINFKYGNEQLHTERVAQYCELIGKALNFSDREVERLKQAGSLHDIGKIMVEPQLLNKTEALTDEEFENIKKHAETGYKLLKNADEYTELAEIVRHHHERYDGKGYPLGLKGEEIPLESRIIAVADAYEAMTGNRAYQKSKTKQQALAEIKAYSGTQFDPDIVNIFLKIMTEEDGAVEKTN